MANVGSLLAIVAGVLMLALTTWPMPAPEGAQGDVTATWAMAARALGVLTLAAPFLTRWSVGMAKGLLALCGLGLLVVGAVFGMGSGAMGLAFAAWVPGVLALAGAALIGPRRRPEVARALNAQAAQHTTEGAVTDRQRRAA